MSSENPYSRTVNLDYDFNYNGAVNFEKIPIHDKYDVQLEKINNAVFLDGTMSLEPRLQEYLKKKIKYKRARIEPEIKLSKTYQITPRDRIIMRQFLNGKTNIYAKGNYNVTNVKNNDKKKMVFLADKLKNDKRVPKIDYAPNKFKNIKNIQTMGMFGEEVFCNEIPDIIDSRDFIIRDDSDEKYRQSATQQPQSNNVMQPPQDRYKMAEVMFNRPSRS